MMNEIQLTFVEMQMAHVVALARQFTAMKKNLPRGSNWAGPEYARDIGMNFIGAMSEMAVAKLLNRYWTGAAYAGIYDKPDIGGLQVRSTNNRDGKLLLHKKDSDSDVFIFVTAEPPLFKIIGWKYGWEAKQALFWVELQPGRPCYAVAQSELMPMSSLPGDFVNCEIK